MGEQLRATTPKSVRRHIPDGQISRMDTGIAPEADLGRCCLERWNCRKTGIHDCRLSAALPERVEPSLGIYLLVIAEI